MKRQSGLCSNDNGEQGQNKQGMGLIREPNFCMIVVNYTDC